MRKIFFFIVCFIFCFSYSTKAFLGEDLGINLYEKIDEGISNLELKQYEYELSGQGAGIKENINKILISENLGECIEKDLSYEEIEKIVKGNIDILQNAISKNCIEENGSISQKKILNILQKITQIYLITKEKAKEKTKKINTISRIGIYSDGNLNNSPFDLMVDLQNIDSIIFNQKIEYEGEEYLDNDELIDCVLGTNKSINPLSTFNSFNISKWNKCVKKNNSNINFFDKNTNSYNGGNNNNNNNLNSNVPNKNITNSNINNEDENLCLDDYNKTGLEKDTFKKIIENINKPNFSNLNINKNSNSSNIENKNPLNSNKGYKKVNDNSVWPCNNFFCITIEFISYNHKLLGLSNISIESILDKSNSHLQKFVSTSLIQSKMTTNNFEFGLRDLNLPDIFHIGFVITSKPVPILNIEKKDEKEDKNQYTKDNLLRKYYSNLGLDYNRKNDLTLFLGKEKKLKSLLDSFSLSNNYFINRMENLKKYNELGNDKNEITKKAVLKKAGNDELSNFVDHFIELNKFSDSIKKYITEIEAIIKGMKEKIPTT